MKRSNEQILRLRALATHTRNLRVLTSDEKARELLNDVADELEGRALQLSEQTDQANAPREQLQGA